MEGGWENDGRKEIDGRELKSRRDGKVRWSSYLHLLYWRLFIDSADCLFTVLVCLFVCLCEN